MLELRRKQIKSISTGDFCKISEEELTKIKATDDYQRNGNIMELSHPNVVHYGDASIFYCVNGSMYNNKNLIEIIPVSFKHDGYSSTSFKKAMKEKMKIIVKRNLVVLSEIPERDANINLGQLNHKMHVISGKFKISLNLWKKYQESRST